MNREERNGYEVMRDERDIARERLDDLRPYLRHDEDCRFGLYAALPCTCPLGPLLAAAYPEERSNDD